MRLERFIVLLTALTTLFLGPTIAPESTRVTGGTLLAEYEAMQLLQNGYSDVCLQTKVTKDGIVRITQAKKHGTVMQAAVMPGQSILAQSWQAI
jgi:hypothetical protein